MRFASFAAFEARFRCGQSSEVREVILKKSQAAGTKESVMHRKSALLGNAVKTQRESNQPATKTLNQRTVYEKNPRFSSNCVQPHVGSGGSFQLQCNA
jgi:hypothetical protein